jgi:hypothetical protein
VDVVNMAREAHKTGGFEAVAVQLEEYRDKNRCRIATEALIRECDNWRYAFKDLNTAIQVARVYSGQ